MFTCFKGYSRFKQKWELSHCTNQGRGELMGSTTYQSQGGGGLPLIFSRDGESCILPIHFT